VNLCNILLTIMACGKCDKHILFAMQHVSSYRALVVCRPWSNKARRAGEMIAHTACTERWSHNWQFSNQRIYTIKRLHQRQRMLITDENTGKQAIYSKRQINQLSIKVVIFDFFSFFGSSCWLLNDKYCNLNNVVSIGLFMIEKNF